MRRTALALTLALLSSAALAQQVNDIQLRQGSSSLWGATFNANNNQVIDQFNTAGSVVDSFRWYQGTSTAQGTFLWSISPTGHVAGAATGGRQGAGTINATGVFVNGVSAITGIGGSSGQIQYNNAGVLGGFTTSGDATINTASGVLTLATVNANVGTFGSATSCITTTANAKGLITAISAATCTPAIASITGLGTGIATALAINVGSAGAPVLFNGAGGTPSSLTLTNGLGLPIAGLTGLGTGVGTALAVNVGSAGAFVTFNGAGGTPSSMVGTNITGLNATNLSSGTVPAARMPALTGDITSTVGTVATTLAAGNAGNLNSGTLLAARMPALTGDCTTTAGTVATTCLNTAYSAFTSTISCNAGTITTLGTVVARQKTVGKIVFAYIGIPITTNGTCAGFIQATLPTAASNTTNQSCVGRENGSTAKSLGARIVINTANVQITNYDGTYPGVDGANIGISCTYEIP